MMLERSVNLVNYDKSYDLNVFTERTGDFNFKDLYPYTVQMTVAYLQGIRLI